MIWWHITPHICPLIFWQLHLAQIGMGFPPHTHTTSGTLVCSRYIFLLARELFCRSNFSVGPKDMDLPYPFSQAKSFMLEHLSRMWDLEMLVMIQRQNGLCKITSILGITILQMTGSRIACNYSVWGKLKKSALPHLLYCNPRTYYTSHTPWNKSVFITLLMFE